MTRYFSRSFTRPIWRKALWLGALAVAVTGVIMGTWLRPAATTQVAATAPDSKQSESSRAIPSAAIPSAGMHPISRGTPAVEQASRAEADTDITPSKLAWTVDASELSRLRARSLTLPVSGVGVAQLHDTYSQARAAGAPHQALDIMAPRGTPVLAVEDGRIVKLFPSKTGGITLYQFDRDGIYCYYYAHLDGYAEGIAEGGNLRKGQVIGYVGSIGNALPDAPHLHFAVFRLGAEKQWWRGSPINPYLLWRDAKL